MPHSPISAPDFMPVAELRAMQLEKLQKLVAYEYERVALFRRRCDEKGVKPRDIVTLQDIAKLPFMVKTDLRDEYPLGLTAAPMKEIVRFHCSSGTTGKPICIPNTMHDVEVWAEAAARCLAMYGITDEDVLQVTYGYGLFTGGLGLHYGGEKRGCAVLPIGGGNTEKQLMLMQDLGVTAIACTPSYFLRIMDVAKQQGIDFRKDTKLRHGIFGAEPWTDEMRRKIQDETGIIAHDIYGLTEISGPGVAGSCDKSEGLHIWEDHYYPEIIDPETLQPLPDGEEGELVFTTLDRFGTPMLRYRTRDLTRLYPEQCACGRTARVMARIKARSDDMLIIHGVNLFPSQVETALLSVPEVEPHYQIVITPTETLDILEIKVEIKAESFSDNIRVVEALRKRVFNAVKAIIGLSPKITLVEPGSLPRSEGKIKRVIDNRRREYREQGRGNREEGIVKTFFQSVLKHIDRLDAAKLREQYKLVTEEVAFFEMVFNAMNEGAVLYDLKGNAVYRNPAAEALPEIEVPFGKASKNEITLTYPEERTLEVQTIPFERGTLAMIRDVSAERARTAEELERGATKSVCDLAAGVAHEIGNPLNAISLNLQMLERDPTDREAIDICKSQVKRLDGIIRGFLGALRPTKPNLAPGSIAEPLKNCLTAMKNQFEERRIKVTLDVPAALPSVALDKDKMEQVFFNLLKNALEAMKDAGTIDISLSSDDRDVEASFRDSGFGMTTEQLSHLFEPYRTTKEHGTGLGLMISSRIVRDHGGTIAAESAPGEGTTFTVRLPRLERRVRELK